MKYKNKDLGPYLMNIDIQRRICLSERIRSEFGIEKSDHLYLTLNHNNILIAFRNVKDMKSYALIIVEKVKVSIPDAEFLIFSRKIQVQIDQRGRIAIPENTLNEANLKDTAKVIVTPDYLVFINIDKEEERRNNIIKRIKTQEGDDLY